MTNVMQRAWEMHRMVYHNAQISPAKLRERFAYSLRLAHEEARRMRDPVQAAIREHEIAINSLRLKRLPPPWGSFARLRQIDAAIQRRTDRIAELSTQRRD